MTGEEKESKRPSVKHILLAVGGDLQAVGRVHNVLLLIVDADLGVPAGLVDVDGAAEGVASILEGVEGDGVTEGGGGHP